MKVTAAGADFVDECPEGVVCRFFRKYDDNMKNDDTIKGASFLVIFSCLIFLSFQYFLLSPETLPRVQATQLAG